MQKHILVHVYHEPFSCCLWHSIYRLNVAVTQEQTRQWRHTAIANKTILNMCSIVHSKGLANQYICNENRAKQAVVRGTTNPAPCFHLVNDTDLLMPVVWAMAGDNKQIDLWPELTQNWIRSSHGLSTPSLKISCKSVQPFSRNVADKETKKSPEYNTPSRGRGN